MIKCDQLDSVHQITILELNKTIQTLELTDSLTQSLRIEINSYKQLLTLCNNRDNIRSDMSEDYKKLWKKERRHKFILGLVAVGEVLLLLAILI